MCSFNRYLVICDHVYLMCSAIFIPQYTLLIINQTVFNLFKDTYSEAFAQTKLYRLQENISECTCQFMTAHKQLLKGLPGKKKEYFFLLFSITVLIFMCIKKFGTCYMKSDYFCYFHFYFILIYYKPEVPHQTHQ